MTMDIQYRLHNSKVCVYNRTTEKVNQFLNNEAKGTKVIGTHSIEEFVMKLKRPRKIILLVKAGSPVDDFMIQLVPLLEKGDLIIDGGNSHYPDTIRRCKYMEEKGFLFLGCGVSGGEEGARYGPSIMPGGSFAAWPLVKEIFQSIAAKADGEPCCDWVGEGGSGHYVKMVHNGIEYGDMQLICEAFHLLKSIGCSYDEMANIFADWNKGDLDSFLIQITRDILAFKDKDGSPLVEKIRDTAGQALYAAKLVSYAQGFMLLSEAAKVNSWKLNYGGIAMMWKGGCIIRSAFLKDIKAAFDQNSKLSNLLLDPFFKSAMDKCQNGWRKVVAHAALQGIPIPAMSSALSFYDGYRSEKLPANLLQAQRDYFGAHTYELLESPGTFHHTNWTGHGGSVSSTSYSV